MTLWMVLILAWQVGTRDEIPPPRMPPLPVPLAPEAMAIGAGSPSIAEGRPLRIEDDPRLELGPVLRLADLERLAIGNHPTLEQSVARIDEARQRAVQAGLYPNPEIAYDHDDISEGGTIGEHGPFIDQPIILAGKLRINRERFLIETEQARWLMEVQRWRILNGVRLRYYRLLATERLIALSERRVDLAERIARLAEESFEDDPEEVRRSDVLAARNALRKARLERDRLRLRRDETGRELASYVGLAALPEIPIGGGLELGVPVAGWDETLDRLHRSSPEILANTMRVRREDYTIRRETAAVVPDIILRLGYNFDHTVNQFTPMWRVTLVNVPIWDRNQGNIREAQANRRYYRLNEDRLRLGIQDRLAEQFSRHRAGLAAVLEYRDEILPDALEAFTIDLELFREREADYSRIQTSESNLYDAQVAYSDALLELRESEVLIHGFLISDTLDEPEAPAGSGRPTRQPGVAP